MGGMDGGMGMTGSMDGGMAGIGSAFVDVPPAIAEWQTKHAAYLAEKKAKFDQKKAESISEAEQQMTTFYAELAEKKAKKAEEKKRFIEGRSVEQEEVNWESVCAMVDLKE